MIALEYKNVILRSMRESDLEDYRCWATTETEWLEWDLSFEETLDADEWIVTLREHYLNEDSEAPTRLEIQTDDGQHIGWVINDYVLYNGSKEAVGINIPPLIYEKQGLWRKCLGALGGLSF